MSVKILRKGEVAKTERFGGFCPYWMMKDGHTYVSDTAEELIPLISKTERIIDPVAVTEFFQFNYMLGNRTLVKGVERMPWRATLNDQGTVARTPPIPHSCKSYPISDVVERLCENLKEELLDKSKHYESIYLLLTGGLDSRIVAAVMKKIEDKLHYPIKVVTWGDLKSRDVVYARRVSQWYEWEFIHIPYGIEETWKNIIIGAKWGGSEVSGIHLHGMQWFQKLNKRNLVIAASYGDSVGRAEFSSIHLTKLTMKPIPNPLNLMNKDFISKWLRTAEMDRKTAWYKEKSREHHVLCELDMQENYMRRMIGHAMDYIRQYADLHQAFTSDKVVSLMWSIDPYQRTDDIYYALLKKLDTRLYNLPWARTGIAPSGMKEEDSTLKRDYHQYGKWLRKDLAGRINSHVFSKRILDLNLFDVKRLGELWDAWQREDLDTLGLGETMTKICSIDMSCEYFDLFSNNYKRTNANGPMKVLKNYISKQLKR